jgi:LuxR family maltose regulon positive regulatory protein
LLRAVDDALAGRVTLISAPAGSGKSTLLHQWVTTGSLPSILVAPGASDSRASSLATEVGVGEPFVVIVDEADPARNPLMTATVREILDRLPEQARLIAARRAPWPIGGDDALDGATRIDEHDLAFTRDEFDELVGRVAGASVSAQQVEALDRRIEGWAAGALLATISLRSAPDATSFIDDFGGDDRHVARYLDEEVLQALDAEDHGFLCATAVLDVLTASACDAVTEDDKAAARLDDLHARGVLSQQPSSDAVEYTCHPLFRELLWRRFESAEPDHAHDAAERAAQWFLEQGQPKVSLSIYARIGMWAPMAQIIHDHGRAMIDDGLDSRVVNAVRRAPAPFWVRERQALIELAFLQTWMGDSRAAELSVEFLSRDHPEPGERAVLDVLRASWVRRHANPAAVIRAAESALEVLRAEESVDLPDAFGRTPPHEVETFALCYRGVAHWHAGSIDAARENLLGALGRATEFDHWWVRCVGDLALLEAWAGQLRFAGDLAARAFHLAEENDLRSNHCLIEAHLALAHVAREQYQLHLVAGHLTRARELARSHHEMTAQVLCAIEEGLLALAEGQPHRGLLALERDRRLTDSAPANRFTQMLDTVEASLRLATGDRGCATELLDRRADLDALGRAVAMRAALAARDRAAGREVLANWPEPAEVGEALERGLWESVLDLLDGDRRAAIDRMGSLVPALERERHVRMLVESLPYAGPLVRELIRVEPNEHLQHFLSTAVATVSVDHEAGPIEPLSERELGIIRYLPTRLTTVEIAAQLYISRNTLKTHLRSIYRKLDVGGRDEAVRRAEELGLA